ncbi:MAG: MMPL family transporter [Kineosporiaceae bacterium]
MRYRPDPAGQQPATPEPLMGPPPQPGAFAALGRFAARRRRVLFAAWILLFVVGIAAGAGVFARLKESNGTSSAESVRGATLLQGASTHGMPLVAVVDGPRVEDPSVRTAVAAAAHRVTQVPGVSGVTTAYDSRDPMLRARDGHASLITIQTVKTDDMVAAHQIVDDVRRVLHGAVPGATVTVGGQLAVSHDGMVTSQADLMRANEIAMPILLVALLFVFRGWRPAVLPIVGSLVTVAGALLLLLGVSHVVDVAPYAVDVVTLFGLALAVDYSLLMVNRFREERAVDADVPGAVERTVAAAGRTITFSALTVAASLAGLFAFGDPTFDSLAIGGVATTVVALAGGLTLVPALLAIVGRKIKPEAREHAHDGRFGRLARRVQRRPVLVAVGTGAALLAAGIPFLSVHYSAGDPRVLPTSFESRQVDDALLARFGQQSDPIHVVTQLPANDPRVAARVHEIGSMPGVDAVDVHPLSPSLSTIDVVPAGPGQGSTAQQLVADLRASRGTLPAYVTGSAAFLVDFELQIATRLPYAVGLIALATFVLLFLMTGSVLVPLKALVMNTLSRGATFGALVWIFQDGHLSGPLGFQAFGAVEAWAPVVIFVFAFGLSMDYEVFLLSRIKESYDEGGDSDVAVANGLQRSGRIITSAAALVMIVFLGFALGQNLGVKEMGLALATAVLVDAVVVRCLLVPATMTLLGDANWWAPAPLRRFHRRFGLQEAASAGRPHSATAGPSAPPAASAAPPALEPALP